MSNTLDLPGINDHDFSTSLTQPGVSRRVRSGELVSRAQLIAGIFAGAVLLALVTFAVVQGALVVYPSAPVTLGSLTPGVKAIGTLQSPIYRVNYMGNGKIAAINVSVGEAVTAGQTLAKIDDPALQDAVMAAQAALAAAQASVTAADLNHSNVATQTQAQLAAANAQLQAAIFVCQHPARGTSSPPSCEQAAHSQYAAVQAQVDTQVAAAQAQVNAAYAQLQAAQSQLALAHTNLAAATLVAPHAGVVAAINGALGSSPGGVGNASTSGAAFISIVDLSTSQVVAGLNQAEIGSVKVGDVATFTVSQYPERQFRGSVSSVSPIAQSGTPAAYPVTIDVDAQSTENAQLLPGATAAVTITTAQRYNVLLVPRDAVDYARRLTAAAEAAATHGGGTSATGSVSAAAVRMARSEAQQLLSQLQASGIDVSGDNPTPEVLVQRLNGQSVLKPVVLGLSDGSHYEVLAGLALHDQVATGAPAPPRSQETAPQVFRSSGGS